MILEGMFAFQDLLMFDNGKSSKKRNTCSHSLYNNKPIKIPLCFTSFLFILSFLYCFFLCDRCELRNLFKRMIKSYFFLHACCQKEAYCRKTDDQLRDIV